MATKSLGTLTLDLVARTAGFVQGMDRSEKALEKWKRKAARDIDAVVKKLALFSTAGVAAFTAFSVQAVRAAGEISRLSQVAGSSATEFQKYAAGAKAVGIEQEKFADILKDVNDKVGDFLSTGGGPMLDFFEKIAPKVGVTAEQFKNLSGPQALELYVSSLEKANISQSEMTFYMEAIANDATLLFPLLRDGAKGFRILGDEAERAGAIMSDDALRSADELRAANYILDQTLNGLKITLVEEILPTLANFAESLSEVSINEAIVEDFADGLTKTIKGLAAAAAGAAASFQLLKGGASTLMEAGSLLSGGARLGPLTPAIAVYNAATQTDELIAILEGGANDLDDIAQRYATLINSIWSAGEGGDSGGTSRLQELADLFREMRQNLDSGGSGGGLVGDIKAISVDVKKIERSDALNKLIAANEDYWGLVKNLRTEEEVINDTLRERLSIIDKFPGKDTDETTRRAILDAIGDAPSVGGLDAAVGGPGSELYRLAEEQEQLEQWYQQKLDMLNEYRQERADLNAQWDSAELEAKQRYEDGLARIERARQQASLVAAEAAFGDLADITRQFAGEQSTAYKVLFAIEKGAAIARSIVAIQTAIAQASTAGPFPANLAAMASVASATAGLVSTIASTTIQGQAHDGLMSVPKTGTYILEKGERVTTAETSAKLDRTLDNMGSGGNIRIVNSFDSGEVVGGFLGSSDGERAVMNIVRRNQQQIRSLSA